MLLFCKQWDSYFLLDDYWQNWFKLPLCPVNLAKSPYPAQFSKTTMARWPWLHLGNSRRNPSISTSNIISSNPILVKGAALSWSLSTQRFKRQIYSQKDLREQVLKQFVSYWWDGDFYPITCLYEMRGSAKDIRGVTYLKYGNSPLRHALSTASQYWPMRKLLLMYVVKNYLFTWHTLLRARRTTKLQLINLYWRLIRSQMKTVICFTHLHTFYM